MIFALAGRLEASGFAIMALTLLLCACNDADFLGDGPHGRSASVDDDGPATVGQNTSRAEDLNGKSTAGDGADDDPGSPKGDGQEADGAAADGMDGGDGSGVDGLGGSDSEGETDVGVNDDGLVRLRFLGKDTAVQKLSVVVAVDTSGSMAPSIARVTTQLKAVAKTFLAKNPANNMILIGKDSPEAANPANGTRLSVPAELTRYANFARYEEFIGSCNALEAVLKLLRAGGVGGKRLRADGALHIIVVTDDDAGQGNCTESSSVDQYDGIKHDAARFLQEFAGLTGIPHANTYMHPFIRLPSSNMAVCGTASGSRIGHQYMSLAAASSPKGLVNDLCVTDADWGKAFAKIAATFRRTARTAYKLPYAPNDAAGIQVKIDGKSLSAGAYAYEAGSRMLEFDKAPADGARIDVTYRPK